MDSKLEVTQADRDAYIDHIVRKGFPNRADAERLVNGWADDVPVLQLLARHRLAALTPSPEMREKMIDAIREATEDTIGGQRCGNIIAAGCEANRYNYPDGAAEAFITGIADAILALLLPDPPRSTEGPGK